MIIRALMDYHQEIIIIYKLQWMLWSSPMAQWIKNPPAMQETQEMWVGFLGWEHSLKKGIATHSGILALRVPWTKEPGGL